MSASTILVRQMSYQVVIDDLRAAITKGVLRPGMSILPERELAEKYGLSMGTVRKGIQELVDAGMLEKVHGKGTFVTDNEAQEIRRHLKIGFLVPSLTVSYFAEMVQEAEAMAHSMGWSLALMIGGPTDKMVEKLSAVPELKELDGIICSQGMPRKVYLQLRQLAAQAQFFFIDSRVVDEEVATATCDDFYGGLIATEHLIEQGCRNIIHLFSPGAGVNIILRGDGYRAAMLQHGLAPRMIESGIHFVHAMEAVSRLLEEKQPLPDGVFCPTDMAAMGVISALARHGVKVPEQVAVVGYSNLLEAQQYFPTITSVELDIPGMIKYAFNEIANQIQHPDSPKSQVRFTPRLHVRESSQWHQHIES